MEDLILSEKEKKLFDFIKTSEEDATIALIELQLGKPYVGALGKLISKKLIESAKKKGQGVLNSTYNPYGVKYIKYYKIKGDK